MPGRKGGEDERREQILGAAFRVAERRGLDRLTIRAVAAEAGLSYGLVPFHFRSKRALVLALLDWLLARPVVPSEDGACSPERLGRRFRQEIERLGGDRARVALFLEYWVLGTRQPEIRDRIRAELALYRDAFRADARAAGVGAPDDLAPLVVGLVQGGAIQALIEPERFDVARYGAAAERLLGQSERRAS